MKQPIFGIDEIMLLRIIVKEKIEERLSYNLPTDEDDEILELIWQKIK